MAKKDTGYVSVNLPKWIIRDVDKLIRNYFPYGSPSRAKLIEGIIDRHLDEVAANNEKDSPRAKRYHINKKYPLEYMNFRNMERQQQKDFEAKIEFDDSMEEAEKLTKIIIGESKQYSFTQKKKK